MTRILDRHFKRVVGYARTEDYVAGGLSAAFAPAALYTLEKFAPSHAGKGGFPKVMRLATFIGLTGGFLYFYQRSSSTFVNSVSPCGAFLRGETGDGLLMTNRQ